MRPHVLVTNDFPPKVGGIQTYLWELWRRLPPEAVTVLTTAHPDAAAFDAAQPFRVERAAEQVLLPTPGLARRIDALADEAGAGHVILDPALPVGLVGHRLRRPYALVVHGSELAGRVPGGSQLMGSVVRNSIHVVAAGAYPAAEAARTSGGASPPTTVVPPGVDTGRFRPLAETEREAARRSFGIPEDALVVAGLSRLVPRKGFDVLIEAAAELAPRFPDLVVAIGGDGRDRKRLGQLVARLHAPVLMVGRVPDERLPMFYGAADVFAMCCRSRWGGLEVEGFGIVFLEAAACGVPQLSGASGGAADAVVDGETGVVVKRPADPRAVASALETLLANPDLRRQMGVRGRERVEGGFTYDHLATRLRTVLEGLG